MVDMKAASKAVKMGAIRAGPMVVLMAVPMADKTADQKVHQKVD
jgi:hypothetical protein